jgi:hypothetical protein
MDASIELTLKLGTEKGYRQAIVNICKKYSGVTTIIIILVFSRALK